MDSQLHLTADAREAPQLRVAVPAYLAKRLGRLEPTARAELEARLPLLIGQLYESMTAVRSLSDDQLAALLKAARSDVDRYAAETARRAVYNSCSR